MKININTQIKNAKAKALDLDPKSLRMIGEGSYSKVYTHKSFPNLVIKVGRRECRYLPCYSDAFPEYASLIHSRVIRSKFYPRIYNIRYLDDGKFVVIMRRYQEINDYSVADAVKCTTDPFFRGRTMPRMKRALDALRSLGNIYFDLHSANIMKDRHGTLILTDPVLYHN